jgi:dihydroxy-acid dehydratase
MATGGSTNAVLHFLAIAHAAGVKWTIDDFERVRRKRAGAVRPEALGQVRGNRPAPAGGMPQVLKMLLNPACCTATA